MLSKIDSKHSLIKERFYPFYSIYKNKKRNISLIGLGSNKGNSLRTFKKLFIYLKNDKRVSVLKSSYIFKNPPFGYEKQNDFYNTLILLGTNMSPKSLLSYLLHKEKIFKRQRSFKNAPRTLDLDIIFFNQVKYKDKNLEVPHKDWKNRASVIIPLLLMK